MLFALILEILPLKVHTTPIIKYKSIYVRSNLECRMHQKVQQVSVYYCHLCSLQQNPGADLNSQPQPGVLSKYIHKILA